MYKSNKSLFKLSVDWSICTKMDIYIEMLNRLTL
jgi:hypothetical protein